MELHQPSLNYTSQEPAVQDVAVHNTARGGGGRGGGGKRERERERERADKITDFEYNISSIKDRARERRIRG